MSDRADLVQCDELQNELEAAKRRQSSGGSLADRPPPSRVIQSYDRQAVGHDLPYTEPPAYSESDGRAGSEEPKNYQHHQQQQEQHQYWGWQQSAERANYPRQTGQTDAGYNQAPHQQFQQPTAQQPPRAPADANVAVIRMADGTYGIVQRNRWSTYIKIRICASVVSVIVAILAIISWLSYHYSHN